MNDKKALVLSVGGGFAAWSTGLLERRNRKYDVVAGSSTGAAEALLAATGEYEELSRIYRNLENKYIYSWDPFTEDGDISLFNAFIRITRSLFKRTTSLGEADNLRKLLLAEFSEKQFQALRDQGKEVIVGVQETRTNFPKVHYFSSNECEYKDFMDWVFFSASAPMIMAPQYKKIHRQGVRELEWTDAGLTEVLPLYHVLSLGYRDIDVILHRHMPSDKATVIYDRIKDIPHAAVRYFRIMRDHMEMQELRRGMEYAKLVGAKVSVTWMPSAISGDGLFFDHYELKKWNDIGRTVPGVAEYHDYTNEQYSVNKEIARIFKDENQIMNMINIHSSKALKLKLQRIFHAQSLKSDPLV